MIRQCALHYALLITDSKPRDGILYYSHVTDEEEEMQTS